MQVESVRFAENLASKESHYHNCHQILFITEGEISVSVCGTKYRAGKGTLLFLSRLETHSIQVLSPVYRRYAMEISASFSSMDKENRFLFSVLVNRFAGFRHVVDVGEQEAAITRLFADMAHEYSAKSPFYEEMLSGAFLQLLVQVYRIAPSLFYTSDSRNAALISEIQEKLEREFSSPITLSELAGAYHISPSHLSHLFKDITGYAPIEYLMACRLSAAKNYLSTTAYSISEIVSLCGYSDSSNFCRMFKEKTGLSPSVFRKKHL